MISLVCVLVVPVNWVTTKRLPVISNFFSYVFCCAAFFRPGGRRLTLVNISSCRPDTLEADFEKGYDATFVQQVTLKNQPNLVEPCTRESLLNELLITKLAC